MTTDVNGVIAEYLAAHKRLVVPQLGAFIVKAPGAEVLFTELFRHDDGVLRGLLTAAGASQIEAAGAVDRLVFDLRHAVQSGRTYRMAGVGTFSAGANGALVFVCDPQPAEAAPSAQPPRADAGHAAAADAVPPASCGTAAPAPAPQIGSEHVSHYEPDPCVKGLTYGRPVKTTEAYTLVGRKPARRIDVFHVVAIIAAILALGVIAYAIVCELSAEKAEAEFMEEVSQIVSADDAAAGGDAQ